MLEFCFVWGFFVCFYFYFFLKSKIFISQKLLFRTGHIALCCLFASFFIDSFFIPSISSLCIFFSFLARYDLRITIKVQLFAFEDERELFVGFFVLGREHVGVLFYCCLGIISCISTHQNNRLSFLFGGFYQMFPSIGMYMVALSYLTTYTREHTHSD